MTPYTLAEIKARLASNRCTACNGRGKLEGDLCPDCGGMIPREAQISNADLQDLIDSLEMAWRYMGHKERIYDRRLTESLKRWLASPEGEHEGGFLLQWREDGKPTVDRAAAERFVENEEALVDILNIIKSRGTTWEELFGENIP